MMGRIEKIELGKKLAIMYQRRSLEECSDNNKIRNVKVEINIHGKGDHENRLVEIRNIPEYVSEIEVLEKIIKDVQRKYKIPQRHIVNYSEII